MFVVATHEITDPEAFWAAAKGFQDPEGFHLVHIVTDSDGKKAVCLWQAESAFAVQQLLDGAFGAIMKTSCFEADDRLIAEAGLPSGLQ